MSVSDPFIRNIKGYAVQLFTEYQSHEKITDASVSLQNFCETLEQIFYRGTRISTKNSFLGKKQRDGCSWMFELANQKEFSSFNYRYIIETVKARRNVNTLKGKFRLLLRFCLVKKCLQIPINFLINLIKVKTFYESNSVLGDEILLAILLSVILQCNVINFDLDLENSSFLDETWQIPIILKLELVPCRNLGIHISFSECRAVIVNIESNSVASETNQIDIGDILENLNGITIDSSARGHLQAILRSRRGKPNEITIIKAFYNETNEIFPPIDRINKAKQLQRNAIKGDSDSNVQSTATLKSGFSATYLGFIDVGTKGSVKQIQESIKSLLSNYNKTPPEKILVTVIAGEMKILVVKQDDNKSLFEHSYMQISSCGSVIYLPNYVGYIAGKSEKDSEDMDIGSEKFTCFIFHFVNVSDARTVLRSIGQGFYRTHFAV